MSRSGSFDFFVDSLAERCDESIEDRGTDGILPQLAVKERFTFDIVEDRKTYGFWFGGGRG